MTVLTASGGEMVRRVNRETVVVLGWGRAILLQLAHPLVAAGVSDHSDYGSSPLQYLRRTRQTVRSMVDLTFGDPDQIRATAGRINAIHRRVHGRLRDATARFPRGTAYTATDPELLRWVHVTLVESQIRTYELFVEPLEETDRDRYCAQAAEIAPLLAIPEDFLPTSHSELTGHLQSAYADGTVEVTPTARRLAHTLLFPPGGRVSAGVLGLGRLVTAGLLPSVLRDAYGLDWNSRSARRLARVAALLRTAHRVLPRSVTEWRAARRSRVQTPRRCPI